MSIFSPTNDLGKLNDQIIDKYYVLEYDFVKGVRIKHKLALRTDKVRVDDEISRLYERSYYYPRWVFETLLVSTIADVRHNATVVGQSHNKPINIVISKLDTANMNVRFKNIIKDCSKFEYKGDTFIAMNFYDVSWDSIRNKVTTMMYNYITKETCNSKYFRK